MSSLTPKMLNEALHRFGVIMGVDGRRLPISDSAYVALNHHEAKALENAIVYSDNPAFWPSPNDLLAEQVLGSVRDSINRKIASRRGVAQ